MDSLLSVVLFICCGAATSYFILRPIAKASRGTMQVERFFLVDLISLIFVLQFPLVFLTAAAADREPGEIAIAGTFLLLVAVALWWRGVSLLSTLKVYSNFKRFIFSSIVLPISIMWALASYPMLRIAFDTLVGDYHSEISPLITLIAILGFLLLPFGAIGLRLMLIWVIRPTPPPLDAIADDSLPDLPPSDPT